MSVNDEAVRPMRKQSTLSDKRRSPLNSGFSEIAMYKLLTDSPAKKTNILKINLSGRFTLNLIDELIIVHHRQSYSSMIFDIKMPGEFDGYVTCNFPIIKKATIKPTEIPFAHVSNEGDVTDPAAANSNGKIFQVIILKTMIIFYWLPFDIITQNRAQLC